MAGNKRFSVWPFHALAIFTAFTGAVILFLNHGPAFPPEQSLKKVSGTIDRIFLVDDLSGEKTAIMKPMNSIHFTLEETEGEFRYPNSWPGFNEVWRQLSFEVDLLIEQTSTLNGEPINVYGIQQRVPDNWVVEPLAVSYAEIAAVQVHSKSSYVNAGFGLLVASACFVFIAVLLHVWNYPPPPGEAKVVSS